MTGRVLAEKYADVSSSQPPGKLRIIAESTRKTDKIDARILAHFLAYYMIPAAGGGRRLA